MHQYAALLYQVRNSFWTRLIASFEGSPTALLINWMNGWEISVLRYELQKLMHQQVTGRKTTPPVTNSAGAALEKSVAKTLTSATSSSPLILPN